MILLGAGRLVRMPLTVEGALRGAAQAWSVGADRPEHLVVERHPGGLTTIVWFEQDPGGGRQAQARAAC